MNNETSSQTSPHHHDVPPLLGVSDLDGASQFINRFLGPHFVMFSQMDPKEFLHPAYSFESREWAYSFIEGYQTLLFDLHQHASHLVGAIFNKGIDTFVEPCESFAFPEIFNLTRIEEAGGTALSIPSVNMNSRSLVINPLQGIFTKDQGVARANILRQNGLNHIWLLSEAYDRFGQCEDWNFDAAIRMATNRHLNAVYPGFAIPISERMNGLIKGNGDDFAETVAFPNLIQRYQREVTEPNHYSDDMEGVEDDHSNTPRISLSHIEGNANAVSLHSATRFSHSSPTIEVPRSFSLEYVPSSPIYDHHTYSSSFSSG